MGKNLWCWGLSLFVSIQSMGEPPRFLKREHCVDWLTVESASAINRTVDFGRYRSNLLKLGYPNRIIDEKIAAIVFRPDQIPGILTELRQDAKTPTLPIASPVFSPEEVSRLAASRWKTTVINQLGYWEKLPGFSAEDFVWQFLKLEKSVLSENTTKDLMAWSHYWLEGRYAGENARRFWNLTDDHAVTHWLLPQINHQVKTKLARMNWRHLQKSFDPEDDDLDEWLLAAVHYNHAKSLPANVAKELRRWMDPKLYPPLKNDFIGLTYFGTRQAGACHYMTHGHLGSLGLIQDKQESWKQNFLIYVAGKLIGSLKMVGDPSMIALRNVVNSRGELVLMMGGVYTLPADLVEELIALNKKHLISESADGKWRAVDLPNLSVVPHRILLNPGAWTDLNELKLFDIAKDQLSKDEVVEVAIGLRNSESEAVRNVMEERTWKEILRRLNLVRRTLERKRN